MPTPPSFVKPLTIDPSWQCILGRPLLSMLLVRVQGLERMREEGREIPHEAHACVLAGQCEWQEGLCRGGSCNQWLGEMKWCVLGVLCQFILALFILVLIHLLNFIMFQDITLITLCPSAITILLSRCCPPLREHW